MRIWLNNADASNSSKRSIGVQMINEDASAQDLITEGQ